MTKMCDQLGIELYADMEAYPAAFGQRGRYVGSIVRTLESRQEHLKHLVLLDPDNGIGESESSGEQVHVTHVQKIWKVLRTGDTLAIVQFQHRIANWVEELRTRVSKVLDRDVGEIQAFPWANLCLYLINR